jgi:hypothetical protein
LRTTSDGTAGLATGSARSGGRDVLPTAAGTGESRREYTMHPHTFYSTLFAAQKRDEVFVVMSFSSDFDDRWLNVIEPVIRLDLGLTPSRVDYQISGESVVTDVTVHA